MAQYSQRGSPQTYTYTCNSEVSSNQSLLILYFLSQWNIAFLQFSCGAIFAKLTRSEALLVAILKYALIFDYIWNIQLSEMDVKTMALSAYQKFWKLIQSITNKVKTNMAALSIVLFKNGRCNLIKSL